MAEPYPTRSLDEDLLARAAEDWVHPAELLGVVQGSGISQPAILRDLAVGLLGRLLVQGLIVVGDVGQGHIPWDGSPGEVLERVVRSWSERVDPYVMPGELFWIDTTAAGQRIGELVWAREAEG